MSHAPIFSIIIPTYNRSKLLPQALESVFRQEFTNFEVIVVDDGSTDDQAPVVDKYGDRVTFLRQDNSGQGAARNRGAAAAKGEYLAFLDSDDLWFPWTLKVLDKSIRDHRSPAIVSGHLVEFTDEVELREIREEPLQSESFADYLASCQKTHIVGSGMAIIRRDVFLEAGGFTDRRINAEDHDLILRLGTAAGFVRVLRPVTLGWRRHEGSLTTNVNKTFEGTRYLVDQERRGAYPGGKARARERRSVISRHSRPVVMECLRSGLRKEAGRLYRETFRWNVALGRWRFLAGFKLADVYGVSSIRPTTPGRDALRPHTEPAVIADSSPAVDVFESFSKPVSGSVGPTPGDVMCGGRLIANGVAKSPFFSVVIPTYNRPHLLREALESIFEQKFTDFEVIVVDDGSTDDMSNLFADYRDRVAFLRQKNAGPSQARNLGVGNARGDYIVFLDSDDLWFPWTLQLYREVIEQHQRPAFIAGCPRVFHKSGELKGLAPASLQMLDFRDYYSSADEWRWFSVSSFVIRRNVMIECGGFSPDMWYGEDADLALRLGAFAGFVQVKSPATFGYRQGTVEQLTSQWKPQVPAADRLLENERNSIYPGAAPRATERRRIISRHLRPVAIKLLEEHEFSEAWRLYRSLLPWNIRLGNWKFVFGFVGRAALCQTLASVQKADPQ